MSRFALPLGVFAVIVVFLAIGLKLNPREIPSPFIGKPAPEFDVPSLDNQSRVSQANFKGDVWVFNVWASWCVACIQEHPILMDLARSTNLNLAGLNYKDGNANAIAWLQKNGNPYDLIAFDQAGNVGIDYGVYGVPETFVIDKQGIIRMKHIGPLSWDIVSSKLLPLIEKLNGE